MDPETAKKLFESGANIILLNVPPGTEIGIDMQSWRTGPEFKGIKMIPSGLHFIYFRFVHVLQYNLQHQSYLSEFFGTFFRLLLAIRPKFKGRPICQKNSCPIWLQLCMVYQKK